MSKGCLRTNLLEVYIRFLPNSVYISIFLRENTILGHLENPMVNVVLLKKKEEKIKIKKIKK